ncbi:MAG: hypothetical protein WDN06_11155 [Asticcacaulis sp.]
MSGAEIGNIAAADGQVGRVIDFADGRVVILPFRSKPDYLPTEAFITQGEVKVIAKYYECEDRELDR